MMFYKIILHEWLNYFRRYLLYTRTSNIILAHNYTELKKHKRDDLCTIYLFSLSLFCTRAFVKAYLNECYYDILVLCHKQQKCCIDRNNARWLAIVLVGDVLVLS